jgi:polysaccharide pyruvyl transferase WcaK-like protein
MGVKVGVFGHYGMGNLGDEAIVTAVIQNIKLHLPDAAICCFSNDPADTETRHQVPAFPVRRTSRIAGTYSCSLEKQFSECGSERTRTEKLKAAVKKIPSIYAALKASKKLIQIPFSCWAELRFLCASYQRLRSVDLLLVSGSNQFLDNYGGIWGYPYTLFKWSVLAKLVGAKLAFVSVGAGPLDSKISRMLVRGCLLLSDYSSFRDEASRKLVETPFLQNVGPVFPDLGHSLNPT